MDQKDGFNKGRRDIFKEIQLEIDFGLLENDENYLNALMNTLLSRNRVEKYLNDSLAGIKQTGNYVGEIRLMNGVYRKYFDESVAYEVHNQNRQSAKRKKYYKEQEEFRKEQIAQKKAKILKAQEELDELEGRKDSKSR